MMHTGGQQEIAVSASVKGLGLSYVDGSDDQMVMLMLTMM